MPRLRSISRSQQKQGGWNVGGEGAAEGEHPCLSNPRPVARQPATDQARSPCEKNPRSSLTPVSPFLGPLSSYPLSSPSPFRLMATGAVLPAPSMWPLEAVFTGSRCVSVSLAATISAAFGLFLRFPLYPFASSGSADNSTWSTEHMKMERICYRLWGKRVFDDDHDGFLRLTLCREII